MAGKAVLPTGPWRARVQLSCGSSTLDVRADRSSGLQVGRDFAGLLAKAAQSAEPSPAVGRAIVIA